MRSISFNLSVYRWFADDFNGTPDSTAGSFWTPAWDDNNMEIHFFCLFNSLFFLLSRQFHSISFLLNLDVAASTLCAVLIVMLIFTIFNTQQLEIVITITMTYSRKSHRHAYPHPVRSLLLNKIQTTANWKSNCNHQQIARNLDRNHLSGRTWIKHFGISVLMLSNDLQSPSPYEWFICSDFSLFLLLLLAKSEPKFARLSLIVAWVKTMGLILFDEN